MQTRTSTFILSLLFSLLLGGGPLLAQAPASGSARLSGQQEVLPVVTTATGMVDVTFAPGDNAGEMTLTVSGTFSGLSSAVATTINGGAHIHLAYPGSNGGIVQPLMLTLDADSLGGAIDAAMNTYTVDAADFADVDMGAMYVNIHTRNYPSGEIRGNVVTNEAEVFYANLLGSNQVPSIVSTAFGAVQLALSPSNVLTVTGSYRGLTGSLATNIAGGAHLHFGLPGANGPVRIQLTATPADGDDSAGTFRGEDNTVTLTDTQADTLRAGLVYANVHSTTYPGGEIRGQVLPPADILFRAHLSGSNEWPVVTTGASGQVLGHLADGTLKVIGSFSDLEADVATAIAGGAHLHPGLAGENGPVLIGLGLTLADDSRAGSFSLAANSYELSEDQVIQLMDRGIYLNIHSLDHPSGEIRGQMLPESQAVFTAFLNGNQQVPSVVSTGRGLVKVELMGTRMTATGSFQGLMSSLNTAIAGGSHLHAGYPGQSGPVIYPLMAAQMDSDSSGRYLPMDNEFTLSGGRADTLTGRFFYVNVHSMDYPGGEIRGSVLAEAESYFLAPLSGASEPQGAITDATGMVAGEVVDTTVTLVGSFMGLDSDFAANVAGGMHLHKAIAGSNGPIVAAINTEIADDNRSGTIVPDSNRIALTPGQVDSLRNRQIYANVHTQARTSGAIRGQMLPLAGSYFHTTFSGVNEPAYVMSSAQGGLKAELIDSMLMLSGSVTMLDGDWNGGAHLHLGSAGVNGPVTIGLNGDAGDNSKSVIFPVDSNTYKLTATQLDSLRGGKLYANIHTTMYPAGEARGQVLGELNLAPGQSIIQSPGSGDSLSLEGSSSQEFRVTYSSAMDPQGDTVVYIWQLATDAEFQNVIFASNTGRDTFFTTDFGTVDVLLDSAGVATADSALVYHRVLASDGSNYQPGGVDSVLLVRGNLTGTRNFLPEGFTGRVYPNPVAGGQTLNYEINTDESFRGRALLYNQLGQLRREVAVQVSGDRQTYPLSTADLPAGQYFLTLRNDDGRLIQTLRLLIQ